MRRLLAAALLLAAVPALAAGVKAKRAKGRARGGAAIADVQPGAAQPIPVRPTGVRPLDEQGTVRNATRLRAYLDAGSREGLAVGQVLQLGRKGQPVGQCTVETVTERNATCVGPGVRAGDTFPVNPRAAGALPAQLPARPGPDEQARRLQAVQATTTAPLEHKGKQPAEVAERQRRVEVGLSHFTFATSGFSADQVERVYAVARDVEVLRNTRLNLDVTGVYRTATQETERFQTGTKPLVWVREASLAWSDPRGPWRLAAGRVLPWTLPGGPIFDGVQAGWRAAGVGELGLFGGAVPDAMTTAPGLDRATAGGYWAWELAGPKSLVRNEARVAWVRLPGGKSRIEGELTAQAWLVRQLDLSAQARFATGDYAAPNKLEALRLDLGWHRPGVFSVAGGYRHDESRIPDEAAPALHPGRTRHCWGNVSWDRMGWLRVRLTGGYTHDLISRIDRTFAGPELAMPRLFGARGGLALGYAEELGHQAGRNAWLQGDVALGLRSRLMARASWFMDARPSPLSADQTAGLALSGLVDLAPWLRLRLSALGRYAIQLGEGSDARWGGSSVLALEARY